MTEVIGSIDVAQLALYAFWIFFAGLIFYLRREDRREGYPLETDPTGKVKDKGFLFIPEPKTFHLPHGGTALAPNFKRDKRPIAAERVRPWPGAPLQPVGDPMVDGVGPASYAERADTPDVTIEGAPKIVPLRTVSEFGVNGRDPDPRGKPVHGADGVKAGTVKDIWVDRAEALFRYYEVDLDGAKGGQSVLLPVTCAKVRRDGALNVHSILGSQFAKVPKIAKADQVTMLEEDKIVGYYAGGLLYAEPRRTESAL